MDKFVIGYIWLMTLFGAFTYGFEFGTIDGAHDERIANKRKLESCQRVIARNLYAR